MPRWPHRLEQQPDVNGGKHVPHSQDALALVAAARELVYEGV